MPIDPTKPTAGFATTQSVRDNFQAAIDELQLKLDKLGGEIDGALNITGDLTVEGAFTSIGIDDNATAENFELADAFARWGDGAAVQFTQHIRGIDSAQLKFAGGDTAAVGGQLELYGPNHATRPGDASLGSSNQAFLAWDESAGALVISTGVGAKSQALVIDDNQNVGIGIASPDGKLHVESGSAGAVDAHANANVLVVESNQANGINILVPDSSGSNIFLGSTSNNRGAEIVWHHNNDLLQIGTRKSGASFTLYSGNFVEALTIDAAGVATFSGMVTAANVGSSGVASGTSKVKIPDSNGNRGGFQIENDVPGSLAGMTGEQVAGGGFPNSIGQLDFWIQNAAVTEIYISLRGGAVVMERMPASAAGLPSRSLWDNGGVVNITP